MGIYAAMRDHPAVSIVGWIVVILAIVGWLIFSSRAGPPTNVEVSDAAWFSTDDGKTWFKDDQKKLAPFEHGGKPASRAYVFSCDGGKTAFVAYLERFTPDAQQKMQQMRSAGHPPEMIDIQRIMSSGVEVKPPGGDWMPASDPRAMKLKKPPCPGKPGEFAKPVLP